MWLKSDKEWEHCCDKFCSLCTACSSATLAVRYFNRIYFNTTEHAGWYWAVMRSLKGSWCCAAGVCDAHRHRIHPFDRAVPGRGRVEVQNTTNGMWGLVCDDVWNDLAAQVFCTCLGYKEFSSAAIMLSFSVMLSVWLDLSTKALYCTPPPYPSSLPCRKTARMAAHRYKLPRRYRRSPAAKRFLDLAELKCCPLGASLLPYMSVLF